MDKLEFKVCIFDTSCCEVKFGENKPRWNVLYKDSLDDEAPAKEAAGFTSDNPYFMISVKNYHSNPTCRPTIPEDFVKANNFVRKTTKASIKDPKGRVTDVKVVVDGNNECWLRFGSGWNVFCVTNKQAEGDICIFEIGARPASGVTVLFDVHIFLRSK